ncbi:MAG: hypothetical protein KDN05_05525, partial [Verrucomicrobiae bacterium]|nr:hypothetical protein [Verrucomicrobiae bacterium]
EKAPGRLSAGPSPTDHGGGTGFELTEPPNPNRQMKPSILKRSALLLTLAAIAGTTGSVVAQVVFSDTFDYGAGNLNQFTTAPPNGGGWTALVPGGTLGNNFGTNTDGRMWGNPTGGGNTAAGIVPGRFGNALHVTGDGGFWQSDWPGLGGDAPRTLAFWIRLPDSPGYIHPLVGWGLRLGDEDTTTGSFFAFAETVDGRTVAGASLGACWIKGSTVIADNSWHHVAVTTTGKPRPDGFPDLRLFIDGREDEAFEFHNPSVEISPDHPMVVATEISHPDSRPLTAFAQILPGEDRGHPFAASMDELRIIEGALDPGEIRHLFEANELPDIHHR